MNRLKEKYLKEIVPSMIKEFKYSSIMQAPKIEKIVINMGVGEATTNTKLLISRALSPAKISSIRLNEVEKKAEIYLKPEEVSQAIGKGGLNIKLASMLTGYTLDVFRDIDEAEETEDIYKTKIMSMNLLFINIFVICLVRQ